MRSVRFLGEPEYGQLTADSLKHGYSSSPDCLKVPLPYLWLIILGRKMPSLWWSLRNTVNKRSGVNLQVNRVALD